jgi:hypothetical protein
LILRKTIGLTLVMFFFGLGEEVDDVLGGLDNGMVVGGWVSSVDMDENR